jgi:hypothetical protein
VDVVRRLPSGAAISSPVMGTRTSRPAIAATAILLAVAVSASGCFTRTVRSTFFEDRNVWLVLRSEKKGTKEIDRGFNHPFAIAPARLAHILSRIDIRMEEKSGNERVPAIATETLFSLADKLTAAFQAATPNQEIAVYSIRRHKRWGVFDHRYLTSFVTYVRNDLLYIHMSRSDWEIPKQGKEERLPAPNVGDFVMKFRIVPSDAMTQVDGQSVAVEWRDPIFKRPTRTSISRTGEVVRRTVLMESPLETDEVEDDPDFKRLPDNLSPKTLRALADLEEQRHNGEISEAEYNAARRQIIRNDPVRP